MNDEEIVEVPDSPGRLLEPGPDVIDMANAERWSAAFARGPEEDEEAEA